MVLAKGLNFSLQQAIQKILPGAWITIQPLDQVFYNLQNKYV